jgi:hypothetical protein
VNPGRTVLAVLAGYLTLIALELLGGAVLGGVLRPRTGGSSAMIGGEIVAFVSGLGAGGITARLAASRPLAHATALALTIVSATSLATAIAKPPAHQLYPGWYPYVLAVFSALGAFTGGVLVSARLQEPEDG